MRALFTSDFFKDDEDIRFIRVKSPAELVASTLRLTGEFDRPRREILDRAMQMNYMGQQLNNPPSVEGWHQGMEWIDTGTLVERLNFATAQLGDVKKPGVKSMISRRVASESDGVISSARLVDSCLDAMGVVAVSEDSREALENFAAKRGDLAVDADNVTDAAEEHIAQMFQMIAACHEFQRA